MTCITYFFYLHRVPKCMYRCYGIKWDKHIVWLDVCLNEELWKGRKTTVGLESGQETFAVVILGSQFEI